MHVPAHDLDFYSRAFGDDAVHTLQEQASRLLDQFLDDEAAASPAVAALGSLPCHMATGVPSTRIIELAERIGASHIVMGSTGRTGLAHLMLGSKAARVVRLSPVPVTIVKAEPAASEG